MGKLDGRVALITGGNSGIGLATAKRFVQEGAYVFIIGCPQAKLDEAVKQVGSNVTGIQGDLAKLGDLDRLFEQIKKEKGKLDIVFAKAGIAKFAGARPRRAISARDLNRGVRPFGIGASARSSAPRHTLPGPQFQTSYRPPPYR